MKKLQELPHWLLMTGIGKVLLLLVILLAASVRMVSAADGLPPRPDPAPPASGRTSGDASFIELRAGSALRPGLWT